MKDKNQPQKPHKVKKRKRLWLLISISILTLILITTTANIYSIYTNVKETVNFRIHKPVEAIDIQKSQIKMEEKEPLTILLMGIDKRENDKGRSDALAVLRLDPTQNEMRLISIPRDTYTEIIGRNTQDKINHAYAFGGAEMTIETVENLLNIELDYYVEMNMEGLSELIDAIGGITVTNELEWSTEYYGGFHFKEGDLELNGDLTMEYVRMRKDDPSGDFGRTQRQRQVIQAIIDKGTSFASVNKINDILDVLGNNMGTNMDFDIMKDLLLHYKNATKNVVSYMVNGHGEMINGVYYFMVNEEEIQKVHRMIEGGESPF